VSLEETLDNSVRAVTDPTSGKLRSVFGIHELSEIFDRLTRDPMILGIVKQLLGSDVYIHQSRINDKAGFSGAGFNWHSDFETWHAEDAVGERVADVIRQQ
jgi:ectoine hydroxylase